jgi:serine/threonine protein kinase
MRRDKICAIFFYLEYEMKKYIFKLENKKMVKQFTRKKGGKLIGKGTYGCIYSPSIKCEGNADRVPNSISKLVHVRSVNDEFKSRNMLKNIDPQQSYFIYPLRKCDMNVNALDPVENNIKNCSRQIRILNREKFTNSKLILYKEGGIDCKKIILRPSEIFPFFRDFLHVLEGLKVLQENNLIHLDIKADNIVAKKMADSSFAFRFIDFGIATSTQTFREYAKDIFLNDYFIWPYDARFLTRYTIHGINESSILTFYDIALDVFSYFQSPLYYGEGGAPDFKEIYTQYHTPGLTADERIEQRNKLLKAVDIYSMGVTMAMIYHRIFLHYYDKGNVIFNDDFMNELSNTAKDWHAEVAEQISKPLFMLIQEMTHPKWSARPSPSDIISRYRELIPKMEALFTRGNCIMGLLPFGTINPDVANNKSPFMLPTNNTAGGSKRRRTTRKRKTSKK